MAERKKSDTGLSEPSTNSMTLSTYSSFSQETCSSLESRTTLAALVHPSPPQTPKTKPEGEDGVQLHSVPWTVIDNRQRTHPNQGSLGAPIKRRCSELDGDFCNRALPSMDNICSPQSKKHTMYILSDPRHRWPTPSSSPEPSVIGDYTSKNFPPRLLGDDPITRCLNALRMESDKSRTLPPLSQPEGLGSQPTPSTERPIYHFQGPPPPSPPPPSELGKKGRSRSRKENHINVKYATEELDYIRYHRVDRNMKWDDTTRLFSFQFPIPGLPRTMPGIQGGYYRQNNGQVPVTTNEGDLCFLLNGHVAPSKTKVREQKDKKLYGLAVLFPERAMNYRWVDEETRQVAAKIGKLQPSPYSFASSQKDGVP